MKTKIESQNKSILGVLMQGKTITPMDALELCGCFRLSARIYDLREQGHNIKSEMMEVNGKRVANHSLLKEN